MSNYAKYKDLGEKKDGQEENNDNQIYAFEIKNLQFAHIGLYWFWIKYGSILWILIAKNI